MPRSMTGFARQEVQRPWGQLICEIRSVNHRYLESNLRLSEALRSLEPSLRETLRKNLGRGKIDAVLAFKVEESSGTGLDLNQELASSVLQMAEKINSMMKTPAPLNSLEVLRWPGVMQSRELDQKLIESEAVALFEQTLLQLIANREREGAELAQFIEQRLNAIGEQVAHLTRRLPELQTYQQEKLRTKLAALKTEIDPDRLAQEMVYLAQKADVSEELDRLNAHLSEVRHTLQQSEPIGRRLDFMMQELNREANTLSSKSTSNEATQVAVELKVNIEQMREQVQNIE